MTEHTEHEIIETYLEVADRYRTIAHTNFFDDSEYEWLIDVTFLGEGKLVRCLVRHSHPTMRNRYIECYVDRDNVIDSIQLCLIDFDWSLGYTGNDSYGGINWLREGF